MYVYVPSKDFISWPRLRMVSLDLGFARHVADMLFSLWSEFTLYESHVHFFETPVFKILEILFTVFCESLLYFRSFHTP